MTDQLDYTPSMITPTPRQVDRVQATWASLQPSGQEVVRLFYARLFECHPGLRSLFPTDMRQHEAALLNTLDSTVASLACISQLAPALDALGRRHVAYGARPEHFAGVGTALLWTLDRSLGAAFTAEARDAWTVTYGVLSRAMQAGMHEECSRQATAVA